MLFTAPQLASVVTVANRAELAMPNRISLPSMLPPDWPAVASVCNPQFRQHRVARLLEVVTDKHADQEHDRESRENRPALPRVADHLAERVGQRAGNQEDQKHRQQVAQWCWVFEWMRGIRVEEAAAVGAELLDRFLRRHRSLRNDLLGALNRRHFGVWVEILNRALRDEQQSRR